MPRRFPRSRDDALLDAVEASDRIIFWLTGKTLVDYESDELLRSGVERKFEIFSEALRIADEQDPALRESLPRLGEVIGMRNTLAHGYFNVDDDVVWSAATRFLPELRERILLLLNDDDSDSPNI